MADQPKGAQANAPLTNEGIDAAQEYDKARDERVAAQNESEELGEGRKRQAGVVQTGEGQLGVQSMFVGAGDAAEAEYVRQAKGLGAPDEADGPREADGGASWTAQSGRAFIEVNPLDVPGQTFTADELPDPRVVTASSLPAHAIPVGLVVDAVVTDSLNTSQERGGDGGTSPKAEGAERVEAAPNRDKAARRGSSDRLNDGKQTV